MSRQTKGLPLEFQLNKLTACACRYDLCVREWGQFSPPGCLHSVWPIEISLANRQTNAYAISQTTNFTSFHILFFSCPPFAIYTKLYGFWTEINNLFYWICAFWSRNWESFFFYFYHSNSILNGNAIISIVRVEHFTLACIYNEWHMYDVIYSTI